jgi:hypothetical protein
LIPLRERAERDLIDYLMLLLVKEFCRSSLRWAKTNIQRRLTGSG